MASCQHVGPAPLPPFPLGHALLLGTGVLTHRISGDPLEGLSLDILKMLLICSVVCGLQEKGKCQLWLPTLWRRNSAQTDFERTSHSLSCPGILRGICTRWERVPCILTSAHRQWVKGWCPCIQTEPSTLAPPFQFGVSRSLCARTRGTWSGAVGHRKGQASVTTASSHPQTGPGGLPHLSVVASCGRWLGILPARWEGQRQEALEAHWALALRNSVVSSESIVWTYRPPQEVRCQARCSG